MKTINYELAKKLYDAAVVIESRKYYSEVSKLLVGKKNMEFFRDNHGYVFFPAPNVEELIEFLNTLSLVFQRPNNYTKKMYNFVITLCQDCGYVVSCQHENNFLFEVDKKSLIEVLEATLEYLLTNGYIGNQN